MATTATRSQVRRSSSNDNPDGSPAGSERVDVKNQAALPAAGVDGFVGVLASPAFAFGSATFATGMRRLIPHPRHRTILPRAPSGTARILLQVRFGHMIRMMFSLAGTAFLRQGLRAVPPAQTPWNLSATALDHFMRTRVIDRYSDRLPVLHCPLAPPDAVSTAIRANCACAYVREVQPCLLNL